MTQYQDSKRLQYSASVSAFQHAHSCQLVDAMSQSGALPLIIHVQDQMRTCAVTGNKLAVLGSIHLKYFCCHKQNEGIFCITALCPASRWSHKSGGDVGDGSDRSFEVDQSSCLLDSAMSWRFRRRCLRLSRLLRSVASHRCALMLFTSAKEVLCVCPGLLTCVCKKHYSKHCR